MLKILLVDAKSGRASLLRAALEDAGFSVIATVSQPLELYDRVAELHPDVVLADANSPARDVVEDLVAAGANAGQPLLMLTRTDNPELLRMALGQGVAAYSVDGLSPALLRSMVEVAVAQFRQADLLRAELQEAKHSLEGRRLIERAKGLLMDQHGLTEAEAFKRLRDESMRSGTPMADVSLRLLQNSA